MNAALGYAIHLPAAAPGHPRVATPNYECTRRWRHEQRKHRGSRLLTSLTSAFRRALSRKSQPTHLAGSLASRA
jgi:hypothetical protein